MTFYRLLYLDLDQNIFQSQPVQTLLPDWQIKACESLQSLQKILTQGGFKPHVVLLSFESLGANEIEQLLKLKTQLSLMPEWVLTHSLSLNSDTTHLYEQLEDMAYAFEPQPLPTKRLIRILSRAAKAAITTARITNLDHEHSQRYQAEAFLGSSPAAQRVREMIERLSQVPVSTLLICGETGTGKGLVARALHHCGLRSQGPMVELNCAAIPHHLIESQLFGHEPGAFTDAKKRHIGLLEQADGGTLFLDEIGDLALPLQAKLLTAIEDKKFRRLGSEEVIEFDAQIFAATGVNIQKAIMQANFREDLYHRLSVFTLVLPALRERLGDLTELIPPMIVEFNEKARKKVTQVPDEVWQAFMQYDWPGNVRELRNVIERCVLLSTNEVLTSQWLSLTNRHQQQNTVTKAAPQQEINTEENPTGSFTFKTSSTAQPTAVNDNQMTFELDGHQSLDQMVTQLIVKALALENNNISRAAKRLGITRQTLRYRMKKYRIQIQKSD